MADWNKSRFAAWRKRNPHYRFVEWARRRCRDDDPEGKWYAHYFAKGIKCHLTVEQVKEIWDRDEAWKLKKPSLDRKNPEGDYVNWQVRFIEFSLNARLAWDPSAEQKPEFT